MSLDLVDPTYTDALGQQRTIAPEVRAAVVAAMREGRDDGQGVAIVRPGAALPAPGSVTLEDGTGLGRIDALPRDVPFGYHRLEPDGAPPQVLITGPGRCHLPTGLRAWGWAIQLATTRSRRSWGIGDLGDLGTLSRWSADAGAGFVAVSPLGAPNPGPRPEPSPYYPSTRRFGSPLHLDVAALARPRLTSPISRRGEWRSTRIGSSTAVVCSSSSGKRSSGSGAPAFPIARPSSRGAPSGGSHSSAGRCSAS